MSVQTKDFTIDGMHCDNCVRHVDEALRKVEGVEVDEVRIGSARVRYDTDEVSRDAVAEALDEAGYELKNSS